MKRTTSFLAATVIASDLTIVACSSNDAASTAGPANKPPTETPAVDSGGPSTTTNDGGPTADGSSSGATCTGPTFDNTRIPGWPTVPQP